MQDLLWVAIMLGRAAAALAYVRLCNAASLSRLRNTR